MIPYEWLEQAAQRTAPYLALTPLSYDESLGLYLKWENRQKTGSFKLRGALNKVLSLQPWERELGLVTASAGNHGQGVALAARQVGSQVVVFASEHAVTAKLEAMRALGADVRLVPGGYSEAEQTGIEFARSHGATWVSPYNDGQVIAGQGTIALDILRQLNQLAPEMARPTEWLVPVGGGGLLSGIGAALANQPHRPRLVGVQSEASPYFYHLFHRGTQAGVSEQPSLADGLAGAVEDGSLTIPIVRSLADDLILVSEEAVARAVAYAWYQHNQVIEGSAAVGLAAVLEGQARKPALAVISGGNIQPELHAEICERYRDLFAEDSRA